MKTHQQLNAIRYDLDGNGAQDSVSASDWANYTSAFLTPATGMGCKLTDHDGDSQTAEQPTCVGYELMNDIDLDTDGDGSADSEDTYWNSGAGWDPIGTNAGVFRTNFKGNGNTINNLFIARSNSTDSVGLFGRIGSAGRIETLGVINANVHGKVNSGVLGGDNSGAIVACYTTGKAQGAGAVGGLVGSTNGGSVNSAYSTAYVTANSSVGGLVGYFWSGSITNSYSTGRVASTGSSVGGLIGGALVSATNSYWDTSTSGQSTSAGGSGVTGKTTRQLQTPTGYTGIYANWNIDLDNADSDNDAATGKDDPWAFGNKMQYPMLDYDGMSTTPQNSQAMGRSANWNAPIVGERVSVCLTGGAFPNRSGLWIWEKSPNGYTWTSVAGNSGASYEYYPVSTDVGNYLRAKAPLNDGTFVYTRALGGRVKQTSAATAGSAITFVSGNASPRVGTQIVASDPRPTGAVNARFSWQRCDNADTTYTDCSYIFGVWWTKYTPVAADVNKYLRMVVYYATSAGVWTRHTTAFTGQVAAASQ